MKITINEWENYWKLLIPRVFNRPNSLLYKFISVIISRAMAFNMNELLSNSSAFIAYGAVATRNEINIEDLGKSLASRQANIMCNYATIKCGIPNKSENPLNYRFCINAFLTGLPAVSTQFYVEKQGNELKMFLNNSTNQVMDLRFFEGEVADALVVQRKSELISTTAVLINKDNEGLATIVYKADELFSDVALEVRTTTPLFDYNFRFLPLPTKAVSEQIVAARVHVNYGLKYVVNHTV